MAKTDYLEWARTPLGNAVALGVLDYPANCSIIEETSGNLLSYKMQLYM